MGSKKEKTDLQDVSIELKLQAKMLEKQAQKIESTEKADRKKILDAMNKGQTENAKIYAENVIRLKKEAISTRRYGLRMGALSSKIE